MGNEVTNVRVMMSLIATHSSLYLRSNLRGSRQSGLVTSETSRLQRLQWIGHIPHTSCQISLYSPKWLTQFSKLVENPTVRTRPYIWEVFFVLGQTISFSLVYDLKPWEPCSRSFDINSIFPCSWKSWIQHNLPFDHIKEPACTLAKK